MASDRSKTRRPSAGGGHDVALRTIELEVPDRRQPGFAAECRRQALAAAEADARDPDLHLFMDEALEDLDNGET